MGASASPTNRGDAEDHIDGTPSSATKQIPSGDDFQRPRVEAEEQEEAEEAAAARKIKVEKEGGTGVKQEHTDMDNEAKAPDEDMHVGAAEKDLNHEQELDEESSEGEEGQADDPDEGANDIPVQLREVRGGPESVHSASSQPLHLLLLFASCSASLPSFPCPVYISSLAYSFAVHRCI